MGFSWQSSDDPEYVCPDGSVSTDNGVGTQFCLWQPIVLPQVEDVKAYCHWLHDGYIGFHWPLEGDDNPESPDDHTDSACDDVREIESPSNDSDDLASEEPVQDSAGPVDPAPEDFQDTADDQDDIDGGPICPTNTYMLEPRVCSENSTEAAANYVACLQMLGGSSVPNGSGGVFTPEAFCQIYIDCDGDFEDEGIMYCGRTGNWDPACSETQLTFDHCE
jgi:hypothetical protein